jgi:UDP-sugar transporter A1/2/3
VLSQLKIVTAAVSSILILKKKLLFQHWASIGLLLVGIALVQQSTASNQTSASISGHDLPQAFIIGLMAMLGACCFSGVASVTIEYLLKNETGFWVSNLLLATYSILPASFIILADCARSGHFQPYRYFNLAAWLSIILNAIGGILVSVVMKYADNILKGFAVSGALIATVSINAIASDRGIPWKRIFASLVVVGSMYLYGSKSTVNVVETRTSTEQHVNLDLLDDPH